ncbi:GNAT family N-acetyltransferase [Nocardia stercoris]|uniref:N-acetyltransferase n=1 Tax=Nocardia stercoris TaxID=2483361 RepID=A0A3M2L7X5_9NOCA|nr:GNAT family N-acetyltransferase [Nocardia stercoris]RMI32820.1 N-acetyltransferase [Nocardia stercoris]
MPELLSATVDLAHFTTSQPTLTTTDGLVLRPWAVSDAPEVYAAFQDPAIQRWHVRTAESVAQVESWIEQWRTAWQRGDGQWAVTAAGELAGRIGLRHSDLGEGATELAYWTAPAWRGRAIAPRAASFLTEWAFTDPGFERVQLRHSVHNEASCRVAAKCGFAFEGTLRGAGRHADGRHDMHLHARLAADRTVR